MIEPIYNWFDGMIDSCRVHDMVLDLIRSLSREENFVTILNGMDNTSSSCTIRRLSLQSGKDNNSMAQATGRLLQARSVVAFPSAVALVPALDSCRVLRVVDLEGCYLSQATNSLIYLEKLHHLRTTRVPKGIGNLTCLERVLWLGIDGSTTNIMEDLCLLTEMRQLYIQLDEWNVKLLECLCELPKIQELIIMVITGQRNIGGFDAWVAPRHLCVLSTRNSTWFSTLPAWVNPSLLSDLTGLSIAVKELHQVHLTILGKLPALRCLEIEVDNMKLRILEGFVVGAGSFPCLVRCELSQFVWPVVFQQGAMTRLRDLTLELFYVRESRGMAISYGGLDLGLGNLPSLEDVSTRLLYEGASKEDMRQAEAALRHAAEMHPNHPHHNISTGMMNSDVFDNGYDKLVDRTSDDIVPVFGYS
ncbi:hypothetical protein HU200_044083 [Digitaria exilis]|uniref:Disease resistance R13L4/SHOC-2-like LRR domain-containing protein n=1 Tax=Digitaria exilis TaxID=1010633 RepID=A0A835B2A7_9POAL|nr:hypothetical protein HU200_044083 [Digitaria exilis]